MPKHTHNTAKRKRKSGLLGELAQRSPSSHRTYVGVCVWYRAVSHITTSHCFYCCFHKYCCFKAADDFNPKTTHLACILLVRTPTKHRRSNFLIFFKIPRSHRLVLSSSLRGVGRRRYLIARVCGGGLPGKSEKGIGRAGKTQQKCEALTTSSII